MSTGITESSGEATADAWLHALDYVVKHGHEIAGGEPAAERRDPRCRNIILERRLRQAFAGINPALPPGALEDAFRNVTNLSAPSLLERNRAAHWRFFKTATAKLPILPSTVSGEV